MCKNLTYFFILAMLGFAGGASAKKNAPKPPVADDAPVRQGRVILVSGSCSSGKSSMAKVLAEQLNAKSFAFDEYVMPLVLKKFIKKHYGGFLAFFVSGFAMRNFFSTVNFLSDKKKYELQLKFYADLKEGMAVEPTSRMYREVKKYAMQGRDVVVEAPLYLWDGVDCLESLSVLDNLDVTYVLAYCPWNDLIKRIKLRNQAKNTKNKRELDWVVLNYMHTFQISNVCCSGDALEYVSGQDIHKVITKYSQQKYKKKRMQLLSETQTFAKKAFAADLSYYVCPRFKYNLTVDTRVNDPEQGAAVVLDYLQKK